MKVSPALCCEHFTLSIMQQGYGPEDGNGEIIFNGDEVEWSAEDGKNYGSAPVARDELLFLRDHLNALFPPEITLPK